MDREQFTSYKDSCSKVFSIRRGVLQGSFLGPFLFSVYVNDLPTSVPFGHCELFADDTSIHVSDADCLNLMSKLQSCADDVCKWAKLNKMSIHPKKSKFMEITTRQRHQLLPVNLPSIKMESSSIERVAEMEFLSVVVDECHSWRQHIRRLSAKLSQSNYQLARIKNFVGLGTGQA